MTRTRIGYAGAIKIHKWLEENRSKLIDLPYSNITKIACDELEMDIPLSTIRAIGKELGFSGQGKGVANSAMQEISDLAKRVSNIETQLGIGRE